MHDFLDIGVGNGVVTVTIKEITIKDVPVKQNKTAKKLVMNCSNGEADKLHSVDEAWLRRRGTEDTYENKGIWLTLEDADGQTITPMSALGKIMHLYNANTIRELEGKQVKGVYKENGFLALITEEHKEENKYIS